MSRILRPNYAQRFLLPPALDEWVPANHPVRCVRDFVDALNLAELGIPEPVADEGRPPYGPDLLLKIWLFGYMERIRSTRALEKACLQIMPFLWLTGNLHPDHTTLWQHRLLRRTTRQRPRRARRRTTKRSRCARRSRPKTTTRRRVCHRCRAPWIRCCAKLRC